MTAVIHIACPHCQATNRLPRNKLYGHPRCGHCKHALFTGKPVDLNVNNTQTMVTRTDIPLLVDCWAPWCGPCRNFAPVFEQAAKELEPDLRLAKLNTDAAQDIAMQWRIQSIPTMILFKNGRELQRTSGAMTLANLKRWLQGTGVI